MSKFIKSSYKIVGLVLFILIVSPPVWSYQEGQEIYTAVPGLIDLRSTFSDGSHSIEELVRMAQKRGFKAVFINDHDRIALSYGFPPFRNILRFKKEDPSIMTNGPKEFLSEISRISAQYPDMIIIPGCETSAYYYLTGSWLNNDITVHEYDRKILIMDLDNQDDYSSIPNLHNQMSLKYTRQHLPKTIIFLIPFVMGIMLFRWNGFFRLTGSALIIISLIVIIDSNPFRSSLFDQYNGDQGIAPYQELIDYVDQRGGVCFWNYPEQRSGIRSHETSPPPIFSPFLDVMGLSRSIEINVNTPPYPQVLFESQGYTGFAAIYGDNITATDPGREWDRVLTEYCKGKRKKAAWGISAADFHGDGRLGIKLGAFPTTFFVKELSKKGIMEAIKNGRMYCSRGDSDAWPCLNSFNIYGTDGQKAYMGDTVSTSSAPVIKFKIAYNTGISKHITVHLIRGGETIHTFKGDTPLDEEYVDTDAPLAEKTFYRLIDSRKHLTSNPIFVTYSPGR